MDAADIPDPGPGQVLVEAKYTCISPGTELRILAGKEKGASPWPLIPGYCMAGTVVACGPDTNLQPGTPVFCTGTMSANRNLSWGGHVSHALRAEDDVYVVPAGVDLLEASTAKLAAIAYHGLRLVRPMPHERVAVIGLGAIGQLSLRLHALTGARVVGADLSGFRVELARKAGAEAIVVRDGLEELTEVFPRGADAVVDTTGSPGVMPQAIEVAKELAVDDTLTPGARYLVQGGYVEGFTVPFHDAFDKELTFMVSRDFQPRDIRAVLELMRLGKLGVRDLISEVRGPDEAPRSYDELREAGDRYVTFAFDWQQR